MLLHEYKAFRYMHLAHHRDTNNPEIDPDHWVAVENPFLVFWRCLTIVFWYPRYFWRHIAFHAHIPGMRPLTIHIATMYALFYGVALGLSLLGYWREVLMLWIFPHILASALIIYFFAYLTQKPHGVHERYRDTNIFWFKGKIVEPVVNWLYMFQNFTSFITCSRACPSISTRTRSVAEAGARSREGAYLRVRAFKPRSLHLDRCESELGLE